MYRAHLGESRFEEIETQALMHVLQHLGESE
jgi:hypothetical protein